MRRHIFTESEVRRLLDWLRAGEEDDATRMLFVEVRRNYRKLRVHLELLLMVMNRLEGEGRLRGRARLPRKLSSQLRSAESKLAQKRRERRTSRGSRN